METTVNNNAVSMNKVQSVKAVANGAKNAGLYATEKPLVGVSIVLRSVAAVFEFGSAATMSGAKQLHTIRKDKESAEAMVESVNRGFASMEKVIDDNAAIMQAKVTAMREKLAEAKRLRQAKADEKAIEAARELLAKHDGVIAEATVIADGPLR